MIESRSSQIFTWSSDPTLQQVISEVIGAERNTVSYNAQVWQLFCEQQTPLLARHAFWSARCFQQTTPKKFPFLVWALRKGPTTIVLCSLGFFQPNFLTTRCGFPCLRWNETVANKLLWRCKSIVSWLWSLRQIQWTPVTGPRSRVKGQGHPAGNIWSGRETLPCGGLSPRILPRTTTLAHDQGHWVHHGHCRCASLHYRLVH